MNSDDATKNNKPHRTGLIAATFTPMDADGEMQLSGVESQVRILVDQGVKTAFVGGSSGEFSSLTPDERMALAECFATAAAGKLDVIVHVGGNCLSDCQTLAAHAERIGACAVAAVPPSYFRAVDIDDLADWCRAVAAAAGKLPFYYYHIPRMTRVEFAMADFLPTAAEKIPTLAGAKFSCTDLADFALCAAMDGGRFDMLFGLDEMLLPALAAGAKGAVGTTYNFAAGLYHRIIDAFGRGDMPAARADQVRAVEMISALTRRGFYAAAKSVMGMLGADAGPVRAPLRALASEEICELQNELDEMGFFAWRG
jgi:N-acetylneuraminate lyase